MLRGVFRELIVTQRRKVREQIVTQRGKGAKILVFVS